MAKSPEYKVVSTVNVNPAKVTINPERLGRAAPVADENVIALADNMRARGQEQPIKARAVEGTDTYEAVFGITRTRAAQMIVNGYKDNQGKDIPANPNFKLRVEVVECTDEEAFVSNVVENCHRNACSPIDNAKNQQKLRDEFDMTDAAIARLYGWSGSALVNRLKKLLTLPEFVQQAIHRGDMSAQAGYLLADAKDIVEANAFEAVWAKVKSDGDGEEAGIQTTQMASAIKEWRKEQKQAETPAGEGETGEGAGETGEGETGETSETGEAPAPTVSPLTLKQLKDVFKAMADDEQSPPKTSKLGQYLLKLAADEMEPGAFVKKIMDSYGEKKLPKKEAPATPEAPAGEAPATPEAPAGEGETNGKPAGKGKRKVARK